MVRNAIVGINIADVHKNGYHPAKTCKEATPLPHTAV